MSWSFDFEFLIYLVFVFSPPLPMSDALFCFEVVYTLKLVAMMMMLMKRLAMIYVSLKFYISLSLTNIAWVCLRWSFDFWLIYFVFLFSLLPMSDVLFCFEVACVLSLILIDARMMQTLLAMIYASL